MLSNFEALALILGTMIFGIYVIMGITRMSDSISQVIMTGVNNNGIPLSLEHRWMMLWNYYTSTMLTGAALAAGAAVAFAQVGRNVGHTRIQTFAYVGTAAWGLSSLLWVLGGVNGAIYMASLLKKTR